MSFLTPLASLDDEIFQIGDVFINTTNVSPATTLGYGTWLLIKTEVLL